MDQSILVSIIVLTYNHENYIRQAIESILNQSVNFKYELLIGDDCSTDGTPGILREYKEKYPDRIQLFLRKKNVGASRSVYFMGTRTHGKYLTVLEGDDYWSDADKLQKQADFLEANTKYYACAHSCIVVDENNQPIPTKNVKTLDSFWNFTRTEYTLEDFQLGKYAGHTSSILTRNVYLDENLDCRIMYQAHPMIGDRTMQLLMASQGPVYVMKEDMSCYRYIENKNASNWQSVARAENKRYEEFAYICYLEKYANRKMHIKTNMIAVKKDKLVCGAVVLLNHFNRENLKVLLSMIRVSGCPVPMAFLALRAIIQKIYYRTVIGEDRPIKL